MHVRPAGIRRGPRERLEAWIATGPLGHLWSAVADLALFGFRRLARRLLRLERS